MSTRAGALGRNPLTNQATYGFMDGEHAFSAALVLVMVNVAFQYNERDAASMEQALSILQGMAQKGNEYIRARHSLLLNLRSALSRQARNRPAEMPQVVPGEGAGDAPNFADLNAEHWEPLTPPPSFQQFQDLSFNLNMDDTDAFWDEFSAEAQIGMNTEWIESAFQHGSAAHGERSSTQ